MRIEGRIESLIAEAEAYCDPGNYNEAYDVDLVLRLADALKERL